MATRKGKKARANGIRKKLYTVLVIIAVIAVIFGCVRSYLIERELVRQTEGKLQVHFIDVGQGDSSLIITPDGQTMLIDAGKSSASDDIISYITELGIEQLDYMMISHYHDDHYGSADDIALEIGVDTVLFDGAEPDNATEKKLISAIESTGSELLDVSSGYTLSLGTVYFEVLAPISYIDDGGNNDSIVMKVTYGETSFMFTGDAEAEEEKAILGKYNRKELSCDVLKVGHHGSNSSTTKELLSAVNPGIAVISAGEGNSYGHPHTSTLDKLEAAGVRVYRTDLEGDILILSDGVSVGVADK